MKLLILTQYYPPETGAPQVRLHSLAINLKKKGMEVEVLTAMPNYPKMEVYDAYRGKRRHEEKIDEIRVVRRSIYTTKTPGVFNRLKNYFSFVWSSLQAGKEFSNVDFILCESPPLFLGIAALYLKWKLKACLIFNVSDLWPESAEKLGIVTNKLLLGAAYRLESVIYHQSSLITGQTQGIVSDISRRFPRAQTLWMPNGIDKQVYAGVTPATKWVTDQGFEGKNIYIYAGIIGHAQGLDVIIKAKKILQEMAHDIASNVVFVLIGDGPEKNQLLALNDELNAGCVFIPSISKKEVMNIVATARGYIVPLKKLELFLGAIPSKLFDPLALGIPILLGVDGEARNLFIEQGESGLFFEPENPEALAKCILKLEKNPELASKLGQNGKIYVEQNFDNGNTADKLLNQMSGIIERRK
jgi:glycosyltransferase involved in cell wall biosynthesis